MPITLITGPANAGKAQLVLESVRRHLAHGGEPRLVVPTQADTEHYLRELAGERAAMGVRVERFKDLLAEICARSGTGARALGELSREQIVASIARELGATGTAGPLARTGLVRALCTLFADLEVRRATPARFAAALRAGLGDEHATAVGLDLAGLYGAYERALARVERPDEERSAMAALDALRERPALWRGTPVLFYGFDDLARLQLDAIETLGTVVDADVTVSLAFEPGRVAFAGRAATFHALAPLAREHRELAPRSEHYAPASRAALSHLERCVFEPAQRRMPAGGKVRLLRGGAQRDELELVARNVRELLDSGLEAHEVAVVLRDPARSAELVRELFTAAGVPFALERRRPFADTSVGRGLVGLLRCVPGPTGATDGSTADLLAWLRCPGAIREQALVDSLEATCRRQGITDATRARAAWEAQRWPLDPLTALAEAQGRGPGALLERVGNELGRLFSRPRERQARVLDPEEVDEARALAAGHAALAELRELARIAPGATPARAAELADVLARVELYSGERPAPGAVAVLDPLSLRARRVRALFVAGLQEGEFPRRARPEPLLAEDERRHVAEASGLLLGGAQDVLDAERYLFYAVLSRPEELLFLSWHDADDDGEPVSRSLFVDDVCDLFTDELERDADRLARAEPGLLPTPAVARERDAGQGLTHELLLQSLRERMWSASSLEKWVSCPVKWFVEQLLEPRPFAPDAEPLARGGLAHAALADTLSALRDRTGSARVTPAVLPLTLELLDEALARNEPEHPLSVSVERRVAVRRRLRADLARYVEYAAGLESALEPRELEVGFGFSGEDDRGEASELPAYDLGGGVLMRGRIDRIDVSPSGDAVVMDYKSSFAPKAADWLADGHLQMGLYMRAVEGLMKMPVAAGIYQPLSGPALRPRGLVSCEADLGLDATRTDLREGEEIAETLDGVLAIALQAAAEARRGDLDPRPATCGFRGSGCAYPTICRCE